MEKHREQARMAAALACLGVAWGLSTGCLGIAWVLPGGGCCWCPHLPASANLHICRASSLCCQSARGLCCGCVLLTEG